MGKRAMDSRELGQWGEDLAKSALERMGWRILDCNVRIGGGELDIVALDGDELVMVEVRVRRVGKLLPPALSVGPRKLKSLVRAGSTYASLLGWEKPWRIDVFGITVDMNDRWDIEHVKDVTAGRV
ncbi:MAG TPA: YraN family protein [Thermosynergistes sp.]|nr:YraN family protein [Thermosynergistes sp.]